MKSFATSLFRLHRILSPTSRVCVQIYKHTGQRSLNSAAAQAKVINHLFAHHLSVSKDPEHVGHVAEKLEKDGILKITLGFPDSDSKYLESLIRNLHTNHNHRLPISHSATRGWFWDVRPSSANFQTASHQARSETMEEFPWHTDCSYEYPPPRYFALQVLQPDRCGGGTLSVMRVERLSEHLSADTLATLMQPEYRIATPTEFVKDPTRTCIHGSLIVADGRGAPALIRFREDIVTPLSPAAAAALADLKAALRNLAAQARSTLHLSAQDLPAGSIILIDNRRWLHARNHVKDPERHLRRVRWDAAPFPGMDERTEELVVKTRVT
ncbi:hypothetical protein NLG97_g4958 [Lecanicillium saksenae]|uniref:Uncharacterized protein n=1 Tax=Lecanicillium saksenae TaxID=468837 RepID=A0ACC1QU02_9HYPO|nr:hypothetical protein NLG97_g4958 [Lecanicillium saksenae]